MNSDIQKEVRKLLHHILKNEKTVNEINAKEKQILQQLRKDTMSFVNRKELDLSVGKMAEKFQFHGFFPQADHLLKVYNKYMNKTLKQDSMTVMNVVRFLLCMSDRPTDKFFRNPTMFTVDNIEEEEKVINWGEYLLEGIEVNEPEYYDFTSDDSGEFESTNECVVESVQTEKNTIPLESAFNDALKMDFNLHHEELVSTIQHTWYNEDYYSEVPPSKNEAANIGLLWEEYLSTQTHGLIALEKTSFISEYKVAREIIWQMFGMHNSFLFHFKGNDLKIRDNVSISSVRSVTLAAFVEHFLEYIELMEYFRDFLDSFKYCEPSQTYLCYGVAIKRNILYPIYEKLIDVEEIIRKQDSWLTRNDFVDINEEFVLVKVTSTQSLEYKTSPFLSTKTSYDVCADIKTEFRMHGIIEIICTKVLQIAKNIRLLFLLRKFDFYTKFEGTLHQELLRRFLIELCKYFKYEGEDVLENLMDFQEIEHQKALVIKYPIINSEKCKQIVEMDKLENLVDTNDSFLMEAFAEFISKEESLKESKPHDMTLFDRISKITTGLFPLRNSLEKIFKDILKDRFSVSGLMVKSALIEDHHLAKILEFLRGLYLFGDSSIYPFFQQFFDEMKFLQHSPWRYMKFSSHLKDMLSEMYPPVCNKCDISLNSAKEHYVDALDLCDSLNINVVMKWPLNIVITEDEIVLYESLFHFIIKLKWAFHTLNSLSCKDISIQRKGVGKVIKNTVKKLEVFKFSLLHCLNFIQHYVIYFCITKCLKQFELDFEKSNDLDSVIKSHRDFVEGVHNMVGFLQSEKDAYNFQSVLHCVKVLNSVWYDLDLAMDERVLDASYNLFKKCKAKLETQVNKIYLMNY
ncbi:hypothetical protein WA026_005156 [Henosepilachna vigintioctopunctata]|uniref:Gamma-tubulin complex component n=1 Tax=Henosepilachna vigintioctopunctata TaxID=420089 RepID=A0AAW1UST2_9CUCU